MARHWSQAEVEATVDSYLSMLSAEHRRADYSKADHRRRLGESLDGRGRGAIERKYQNISSVLLELGLPYIDGYKPLGHYQRLLFDVVEERLSRHSQLLQMVEQAVLRPVEPVELPRTDDILSALVQPPQALVPRSVYSRGVADRLFPRPSTNYLAMEANNRSLGTAGEEFVMHFEKARLIEAGQRRLASRIDQVSLTRGDTAGYDVLSYETTGRERLIEVKTTAYGSQTPFFVTRNELAVSYEQETAYYLYRVFDFRRNPRLFHRKGRIDQQFALSPEQYLARVE